MKSIFRRVALIGKYHAQVSRGQSDSMRDVLEGRRYAERYIQTLTHEMKSPLAAIRGAAELLDEEMPVEVRKRFLENIRAETSRSERLINRLLELASIESRTHLETHAEVDLGAVVAQAIDQSVNQFAGAAGFRRRELARCDRFLQLAQGFAHELGADALALVLRCNRNGSEPKPTQCAIR